MIEVTGNLWTYPADVRVITTNGFVKKNGEAVMGRGCAKEANERYYGLASDLGRMITKLGNHVFILREPNGQAVLCSFPVKHRWFEEADLKLIEQSAGELSALANAHNWQHIVVPRPGCGNGKLKWETVKPVLEPILTEDRFKIISF